MKVEQDPAAFLKKYMGMCLPERHVHDTFGQSHVPSLRRAAWLWLHGFKDVQVHDSHTLVPVRGWTSILTVNISGTVRL